MKFDPFTWNEVKTNEKIPHGKGRLRLQLSASVPLYIEAEGYEALAGVGTSFELDLSEAVTYRAEAPKGVRMFVHVPFATTTVPVGEVFTNIDRMPDESGALAEVTRATRLFQMEQRNALREIRAERDALRADSAARAAEAGPEPKAKRGPTEAEGQSVIETANDEEAEE